MQWVAEAKRRGIKTIARLTQDYPSIDNHVRALKEEAAKVGIAFVYEDRFEATTTDFKSRIGAAKATSPDLYFVEGFNPALDILGQQLKDAGVGGRNRQLPFRTGRVGDQERQADSIPAVKPHPE